MADSLEGLQNIVNSVASVSAEYGVNINTDKTKFMGISQTSELINSIYLNGQNTKKYELLQLIMQGTGRQKKAWPERNIMAQKSTTMVSKEHQTLFRAAVSKEKALMIANLRKETRHPKKKLEKNRFTNSKVITIGERLMPRNLL
ncbi:jg17713 [Pararge aegeria aegeria]|uniref:Jg17713 protein n=1 Tax=Pararge aegeria aegeria TaxID=348720 RepID=A0A8S4QHY8_9NEOP|nr:jg17713 [Pararge aegeria aegeria]